MRTLFQRVEKNTYLAPGTPGHGFDGYLDVTIGDGSVFLRQAGSVAILKAMAAAIGDDPTKLTELLTRDGNFLSDTRDVTQGLYAMPFHATPRWRRVSSRDYILATVSAINEDDSKMFPLYLQLNSLASKVLFETPAAEATLPKATGVEFLEGKALYSADPRYDPSANGTLKTVKANREVIVSGGVFNTPQLLQLSGIGDAADLAELGIPVIADLPGVGRNMQDNEECPIVGLARQDIVNTEPNSDGSIADPPCTFDGSPSDPCLELWLDGKGPYATAAANSDALLFVSNHSLDGERDVLLFSGPIVLRGFWPFTTQTDLLDPPNTWGMMMVKIHPQNKAGYVKLRSTNPRDTPEINFELFKEGADTDLGAMADAIAWGRRVHREVQAPFGPLESTEPPCAADMIGADGRCGASADSDKEWLRAQVFGHHATSTAAIGSDSDRMAVLDSKFRVRGVQGLRVVDASAFPRTPGAFPVICTFMLSEKATDAILGRE